MPRPLPLSQGPNPYEPHIYQTISLAANGQTLIGQLNYQLTVASMTLQVTSDCTVQLLLLGQPISIAYNLKAGTIWSPPSRIFAANAVLTLSINAGFANVEIIYRPGYHSEDLCNHVNRFYLPATSTSGATSMTINPQTGTSYTILDSDNGKVITQSNTSAATWTLPQPGAQFISGWFAWIKNIGSGMLTINITTANCDGATVIFVPPGGNLLLLSNGTNYEAVNHEALNLASSSLVTGGMGKWTYVRDVVNAVITGVANQTRVSTFYLQQAALVNKIAIQIQTLSAGAFAGAGLYSPDGNVKLVETGAIDCSTTGLKTVTLGTTYLFLPGEYQYAYTCSDIVAQAVLLGGINAATISNIGTPRVVVDGTAANASVGGVLPATLGALAAQTQNRLIANFFN